MATAPTLPLVSVEEYLKSSWHPDMEFVDGVLLERNLHTPPRNAHPSASRVSIKVSPTRCCVPDIIVAGTSVTLSSQACEGVPPIVVEILSPEDRLGEVVHRFKDYAGLGVLQSLLLDPVERVAYSFHHGSLAEGHITSLDLPDGRSIPFPTQQLIAELDEE
jgi:Uma2 family endonuclease